MKKLITLLFLLVAINSFGQLTKKPDPLNIITNVPQLTDSTWLISWKDYTELKDKMLLEMPTKYGLPIMQWFEQRLQDRIEEWKRKNKKP